MIYDFQNDTTLDDFPYRVFDANGVQLLGPFSTVQWLDTVTGECRFAVMSGSHYHLNNAGTAMIMGTFTLAAPLEVIGKSEYDDPVPIVVT